MRHATTQNDSRTSRETDSIRDRLEADARRRYPALYQRLSRAKNSQPKRSLRWQDRTLLILASFLMAGLLLRSEPGIAQEHEEYGIEWAGGVATAIDTRIGVEISGLVARTEVTQVFVNHGREWAEAVYRFPLPDGAAVDQLLIQVGDRTLVGEIQEKQVARRTYQRARSSGQTATLVEQQRANQFETRLANIGPGEEVRITIGFLAQVEYREGDFSFSLPMTFTPRAGAESQLFALDSAPQPVLASISSSAPIQRGYGLELAIDLQSGLALSRIDSEFHDVDIHPSLDGYHVFLSDPAPRPDRVFKLTWSPELGAMPKSSITTWDGGDAVYAMLMLAPPLVQEITPMPREVIFIIDTSGSMEGESIREARAALLQGLVYLAPDDLFNVIQFNSVSERLFEHSVMPFANKLERAVEYIDGLRANGGTNMAPALHSAMTLSESAQHLRQIVFITDGSVGNEHDLLVQIGEQLGETRLFTVSIGSAPNTWFMNKAAIVGRGSHTHIGRIEAVESSMTTLWSHIQSPALMDICVDWGMDAEYFPEIIPDLYAGEPLWLYARLPSQPREVTVCGEFDGANWEQLSQPSPSSGSDTIATLWARSKIESLEDSRLYGTDPEWIREQVTDVALNYGLLTQYTSLVAVDKSPVRPTNASLQTQNVPSLLPAGSTVATGFAATASGWKLQLLLALIALAIAAGLYFLGTGQFGWGRFAWLRLLLGRFDARLPMAPSTPPQSRS